jgi:hypothetical protein
MSLLLTAEQLTFETYVSCMSDPEDFAAKAEEYMRLACSALLPQEERGLLDLARLFAEKAVECGYNQRLLRHVLRGVGGGAGYPA